MVLLDNSILCLLLHPSAKHRESVERVTDRIDYLIETLQANKDSAIIPTPALSEFLVLAGRSAADYLLKIRESGYLRIEPFDERAAIELADMEIVARAKGAKRGSASTSEWQKVKFDRQIVAIAKVHKVSVIYSDDPDIRHHGKDVGISVIGLADLPLPPASQISMNEVWQTDEPTGDQATLPTTDSLPGGPAGSSSIEAGAETTTQDETGGKKRQD